MSTGNPILITIATFPLSSVFGKEDTVAQLKQLQKMLKKGDLATRIVSLRLDRAEQVLMVPSSQRTWDSDVNQSETDAFNELFKKKFPGSGIPRLNFWQFESSFVDQAMCVTNSTRNPITFKVISGQADLEIEKEPLKTILAPFNHFAFKKTHDGPLHHLYMAKESGTHLFNDAKILRKQGYTTRGLLEPF